MRQFILSIIIVLISLSSKAQIHDLYEGENVLVKGVYANEGGYLIKNYDNDNYWAKLGNYVVNFDDNLNILENLVYNDRFMWKANHKLYGFNTHTSQVDQSPLHPFPHQITDSLFFSSYNLRTGFYNRVKIPRDSIGNIVNFEFSQEKNAFIILSCETYGSSYWGIDPSSLILTMIDTAGNIIDYRVFEEETSFVQILELGNTFLVNTYNKTISEYNHANYKMYYIDKSSLEIVDSISSKYYLSAERIDDSTFLAISEYEPFSESSNNLYMYKVNINTKIKEELYYGRPNLFAQSNHIIQRDARLGGNICSKDLSSKIVCYTMYNDSALLGFAFDNVNIDSLSFGNRYINNEYEPLIYKGIYGVIYAEDGGIILCVTNSDSYFYCLSGYLLKFYPDGRESKLVSINQDEIALSIFPNPANENIIFATNSPIKKIDIYNMLSQKVFSQKANTQSLSIDISNLVKGSYIAEIQTKTGSIRKQFIVN